MASVSSVNQATTSSIYGTRNVLSGLASGMDTESMIENAISGMNTKINSLYQQRTKIEWQQEAYRSIIDKMLNFTNKYTSYASDKNIYSASFFNKAVITTAQGDFADKVSASGKTSSDIQLLGVKQLAKAATYTVSGVGGTTGGGKYEPVIQGEMVNLKETMELSNISGTMTINYGGSRSYTLSFDDTDVYKSAEEFAAAIESKLGEQNMTLTDGSSVKANEKIGVRVNGDSIEFYDKGGAGNNVYVSSATGDIKDTLGIKPAKTTTSIDTSGKQLYSNDTIKGDYLKNREMTFTVDGVTKKFKLDNLDMDAIKNSDDNGAAELERALNEKLKEAFGTKADGNNKVSAKIEDGAKLSITAQSGSTMSISGGQAMGLSKSETTYTNTGKTLGEILGEEALNSLNNTRTEADGDVTYVAATKTTAAYYKDAQGHRVAKDETDGKYYRVDANDNFTYEFKVNDTVVGRFSKEAALESVITAINSNAEAGVNANFSQTTNQFKFTAQETGSSGKIEFGEGLAQKLFGSGEGSNGSDYDNTLTVKEEAGQDAIFSMSVNGVDYEDITRSSNTFDVDGLSINIKGTFNYEKVSEDSDDTKFIGADAAKEKAVSFTTTSDADKIVDVIKEMVNDYNEMVNEIKSAYSTMPAQKTNGSRYEPLTSDQESGMTESEIKNYNEKAKQGILFADSDLSSLYSKLRSAIAPGGTDDNDLKSIGIRTAYTDGLTTISLDESALRSALETNPDKVKNVFTKTTESGSATNGLMQKLKTTIDSYARTTGEYKGVLIAKAGSVRAYNTTNNNALQNQINRLDKQIEKWQDKISDKIDYYTSKFTALEKLIAEMNSQSSALMGLMGGYSG